jgi:Raf kinase inhibitor-like YbhB/YbcL family protein
MAITINNTLSIKSRAFNNDGYIPRKYSCEGENINPPFEITDLPEETKTVAIIVEDPDARSGTFVHWIAWNISPHKPIEEGSSSGVSGYNGYGKTGYMGPCPPSGSHRYYFKIFALDVKLDLAPGADKEGLYKAMQGHILAMGELIGHYSKK